MFKGKSIYNKFLLAVPAIAVSFPALAVDEIIVTAERIEANLQEVPMAVTALSAADLETNNITSTMELTKTVPGMVYRRNTGTAGASNVYIRGFGDDESRLTDPTTGLYIDGVYIGRPYGSLVELIDAGSVEVLRGPQGTLYGRNTIAGAIKINSADRGEMVVILLFQSVMRVTENLKVDLVTVLMIHPVSFSLLCMRKVTDMLTLAPLENRAAKTLLLFVSHMIMNLVMTGV